jgi:hypothetical protein
LHNQTPYIQAFIIHYKQIFSQKQHRKTRPEIAVILNIKQDVAFITNKTEGQDLGYLFLITPQLNWV